MKTTADLTNTGSLLPPRWLHIWAIVTALAALPPLYLGAEVTTKGVGMVDPDGLSHVREPWIFLRQWLEGSLLEPGLAWAIEHGHRLAGNVVGICAIILALGLAIFGRKLSLRLLGPAALLAVIVQGVLGIFRVQLHALVGPNLALIHGCTAPLVLALLVAIAVLTAPGWGKPAPKFNAQQSARLRRLSLALLGLIYLQLVLGALVRHPHSMLASRLHILTAFAVLGGVVWLLKEWLTSGRSISVRAGSVSDGEEIFAHASGSDRISLAHASGSDRAAAAVLAVFVGLQLFLGVEALLSKFRVMEEATHEPLMPLLDPHLARSLHYVLGALVFSAALVAALLIFRRAGRVFQPDDSAEKRAGSHSQAGKPDLPVGPRQMEVVA